MSTQTEAPGRGRGEIRPPVAHARAADGASIAYRFAPGKAPVVVFLGGFRSDMSGTKARAIERWCAARGHGSLCLDYRGHGLSGGRFDACGIGEWLADVHTVLAAAAVHACVLVGSSMGAWLALLVARRAAATAALRLDGVVGIAAAADFTEALLWPRLEPDARDAISRRGVVMLPSRYGDGPYPITRHLLDDGRRHLVLNSPLRLDCPLRLLHGTADPDVPWEHAARTLAHVDCDDATLLLVRDGDHRLSEPGNLHAITRAIAFLCDPAAVGA